MIRPLLISAGLMSALSACEGPTPVSSDGDAVQQRAVEAQTARRRTGAEIQERMLHREVQASYVCVGGDRLTVDFDNAREMATVRNSTGQAFDLHLERAETGIWYRASGHELRGEGTTAIWTVRDRDPVECRAVD
ncbi:MliC family protein [Brevundimonas sp.]|uniref:MliC family protein n=1 Tax=Brevundimonas sp. TaxID=1871086 RepID=UPI003519973C